MNNNYCIPLMNSSLLVSGIYNVSASSIARDNNNNDVNWVSYLIGVGNHL